MLQRRKSPKMGLREAPQLRSSGHLKFVRGFVCAVQNAVCNGRIEAAHVRGETDGGLGVKPSDYWTIPLCAYHHATQHAEGEGEFQKRHNINMKKVAQELWQRSPHRLK